MLDGRDRKLEKSNFYSKKEFNLKYIVLGYEINNNWSSDIPPTIKYCKIKNIVTNTAIKYLKNNH